MVLNRKRSLENQDRLIDGRSETREIRDSLELDRKKSFAADGPQPGYLEITSLQEAAKLQVSKNEGWKGDTPSAAEVGERGGWRGHERSERIEGVPFCDGSGLRKEGASFLQWKQARSTEECPSATEAGCAKKARPFCSGNRLAQRRSVLLRRKRAAPLGGCRGETPRTPPAAGEVPFHFF
jgi:hypothetical protein